MEPHATVSTVPPVTAGSSDGRASDSDRVEKSAPPLSGAIATGLCVLFGGVGVLLSQRAFPHAHAWSIAAYVCAYLAGGYGPSWNAFEKLRHWQLNVDLLMILAAVGAAAIGDWV